MSWQDIFDFLKMYYKEILTSLSFIISVIILIVKRKPVFNEMDLIKEHVLEVLPSLIISVEKDGNGVEKLNTVLSLVKEYLKKKFKFTNFDLIEGFVKQSIENILETPSKKGENNGEKRN